MGLLDKAKLAAEQAVTKAKEGVEDVQTKRELGAAYGELGKKTFELVEAGELDQAGARRSSSRRSGRSRRSSRTTRASPRPTSTEAPASDGARRRCRSRNSEPARRRVGASRRPRPARTQVVIGGAMARILLATDGSLRGGGRDARGGRARAGHGLAAHDPHRLAHSRHRVRLRAARRRCRTIAEAVQRQRDAGRSTRRRGGPRRRARAGRAARGGPAGATTSASSRANVSATLIVIGSHGWGTVQRLLFGSVSGRCCTTRRARCSSSATAAWKRRGGLAVLPTDVVNAADRGPVSD